jgi:hypothetical protein
MEGKKIREKKELEMKLKEEEERVRLEAKWECHAKRNREIGF